MLFYDVEEAKRELTYLFGVIDMFNMSDAEKKKFLEETYFSMKPRENFYVI